MFKRLVSLLVAVTMLCGILPVAFADASDPTVITVWSNDAHSKDIFTKTVEEFNATKGKDLGIKIELSVYGTDYYSTLDIALSAGEAPYIFKCNKIPQYARAGRLAAYEDLPGGTEFGAPYAAMNSVGVGIVDGKTYSVPFKATTTGLAYNVEMFNKLGLQPPTTWDELVECARVITENGNGLVYGYGLGMSYTSYGLFFMLSMASATTGNMGFDHGTGRYNFSALAPFMEMMVTMADEGYIFPGYETMDDDTKRAQFAAGNIGMIPVFSPDVAVLTVQFPANFEWAVIPFPTQVAGQRYKMYSNPSTFYVVNKAALDYGVAEQVMVVMNELLGVDHLLKLFDGEKDMISRADVKALSTNTSVSPQWKQFGDSSYRYTGYGMPDGLLSIEGDTYKDVFDKIMTGLADPVKALADLDARYNAALDAAIAGGMNINDYIVENYADIIAYTAE